MKDLYTAHVHVVGGRQGSARSDDGQLDLTLAMPKAIGGDGAGANPEQLFAAGFAGCFASSLQFVAQQRKLAVGAVEIAAAVTLGLKDDGGYGLKAMLDITLPGLTAEQAQDLVSAAQRVCAYTNATRGNVDTTYRISA